MKRPIAKGGIPGGGVIRTGSWALEQGRVEYSGMKMKKKEERKMEMRRLKYPMVIVLVAALAMILGAGIAAASPPTAVDTCYLRDSTGTKTAAYVQVSSVVPGEVTTRWNYQVIGLGTKGTQFAGIFPICEYKRYDYSRITEDTQFYITTDNVTGSFSPASLPSNYNGFGVWDAQNDQLITITSIGSSAFGFFTDNNVPIPTDWASPMQFKSGNSYYYCPNIKGPGCVEPPPPRAQGVVSLATRYEGIDPYTQQRYEYCATTDPATQCQQVVDCDTMVPKSTILMTELNFGSTSGTKLADISVPGVACPGIVLSDNAENSTYYCNPRTGYCVKLN